MGGAGTANKIQLPVALTFDFDAGSCWPDTTNTEPPCAALRAACGATETIPLICNLLQRCKVPATFLTPDYTTDHHSSVVRSLAEATEGRHGASPEE
jgi:hypothetical protein